MTRCACYNCNKEVKDGDGYYQVGFGWFCSQSCMNKEIQFHFIDDVSAERNGYEIPTTVSCG